LRRYTWGTYVLRIITTACALLVLSACNHDAPAPAPTQTAQGNDSAHGSSAAHSAAPNAAPGNLDRFGAAAWLPADYAYFSSAQDLGGLLEDMLDSRTLQSLARLPLVMVGLSKLEESLQPLTEVIEQTPLLQELLSLGAEAAEREIFLAGGKELETFTKALSEAYVEILIGAALQGATGQTRTSESTMIAAMLPHRRSLRMPPIVFGMRVADSDRAKKFLSGVAPYMQQLPGIVAKAQSAEGFEAWTITDANGSSEALQPQLRRAGVPKQDRDAFVAWVAGQQITIALGVRDDYLLLSISDTTDHLNNLGSEPTLASQPVFRRARARADTPMLTTYISSGLRPPSGIGGENMDGKDMAALLRPLLGLAEDHPKFFEDLGALISELAGPITAAAPYLTVTYHNEGLETLTIDGRQSTADSSQPLTLLAHAGLSPTLAYASRAEPSQASYKRFSHWTRVMFRHYQDIVVPGMPESSREEFEIARSVFGPQVAELDAIMQDVLLPAIDEHDSMLVLDQSFNLELGPSAGFADGLAVPRVALMWRVQNSSQVATAFDRARAAINHMLVKAAEQGGRPVVELPAPQARTTANGTLYAYDLSLPAGLSPCVLVNGEKMIFALTPAHAEQLMKNAQPATNDVVDHDKGASSAVAINVAALSELLRTDAMHMLRWASQSEQIPAAQATLIWTHLEPALKALAAMRSYQSRTWHEGHETIQHSWLKVSEQR
tara:strand:- start:29303 stop:31471 length:2169 start_codon:yes stop_codon:yes gene_type:complete